MDAAITRSSSSRARGTCATPEDWYGSASKTILKGIPAPLRLAVSTVGRFSPNLRQGPDLMDYMEEDLFRGFFEGRNRERDYMIARFVAWNEEVQRTVPKERLLVYEVKQGWEPLCAFLGVPVPSQPLPSQQRQRSIRKPDQPRQHPARVLARRRPIATRAAVAHRRALADDSGGGVRS